VTRTGGWPSVPIAIRRLFIANRGEIARRIERTCRQLGIEVVVPVTDGPGALDLLDAGAVVGAARDAGVDALHPGFGFLAESAAFAAAVEEAGIRWVGPPPAAIAAMGDKAAARRLAASLGVPVLPGYDGDDQSDHALAAAADRIGLPLLVKPAAGGGGKGMRTVRERDRLPDALAAARREARAAFGDDRLVLERLLERSRHVEIQVLFDRHRTGVHLGERDCSIQRRHQKVLEESPSPAVDDALRARMGAAALRLAAAVGYVSAGTVEFLLDAEGGFHFLEMNTRLQVEHPVTELVLDLDLVAEQMRIATGEPLGHEQPTIDARRSGHAVEVRLYAEDPEAGFLPATGRIERLRWPDGEGVRVDAGVDEGGVVSDRFDPMLAKVIAHAPTRDLALDRTLVLGLVTNLRFLRWLVRHPVVRAGEARVDTLDHLWPPDEPPAGRIPDAAWLAAARALHAQTANDADPWSGGWRLNAPPRLAMVAEDGSWRTVEVPGASAGIAVVDPEGRGHVDIDGRSVAFRPAPPPEEAAAARAAAAGAHAGGGADLVAPMPGLAVAVHVAEGATVEAGDPLVTLEAMKMEHLVAAPVPGTLVELLVRTGDQVTRGQLLGRIDG